MIVELEESRNVITLWSGQEPTNQNQNRTVAGIFHEFSDRLRNLRPNTQTKNNFENLWANSDHTVPGSLIGDGQFKVILC